MSRTDNTKPYSLQAEDPTLPGYVFHQCGGDIPCDYAPDNGVKLLREGNPNGLSRRETKCFRRLHYYGGIQEDANGPRQLSKRQDSRERRYAARRALRKVMDPEDFDILPVRADRGDHNWFD